MTWRRIATGLGLVSMVVALSSAPAGGQATERSSEFLALTYNVAGLPEPFSGSEPDINTPLISPLLNAYDLVLVQEDWIDPVPPIAGIDFHHDDLISQVDHPFLSEPATPPIGTDPRRPEALVADGLNHLSRFPFGPITREMWTNCFGGIDTSDGGAADCLSQKGFALTRVQFAAGVEVDVYNLHGEAGSTPLDVQYSADDYEQLAAFIVANSAGRPILLGGDTNLHTDEEPDHTVWEDFKGATGIVDVCDVLDCGDDADEIDKFAFRSDAGVTLEPLTHEFERDRFRRSDGVPLSDHDALAVTFEWTVTDPAAPVTSTTAPAPTPVASPAPAAAVAVNPRYTG